jgi:hypothetical protein
MPRPKKTPLVTEAENAIDVVETSEVIEDLNTIIIDDELFNFDDLSEPDYDEDFINLIPGKLYYEIFDGYL